MADVFGKEKRSAIMANIRSRGNRTTELALADILRKGKLIGWRRKWPIFGNPDFVFPKQRLAIFVDGCFWHGCPKCYTAPATNRAFWRAKIQRNRKRDLLVKRELKKRGWKVLRFRECELKNTKAVLRRMQKAQ